MTLSEYINSFPRNLRSAVRCEIANFLHVSEVYVRSMCNGNKPIPGKFAIPIEQITGRMVPRQVTAPEFYPIEE